MKLLFFSDIFKISRWLVWGLSAVFALLTFVLQGFPSVMISQLMATYRIDVVTIGVLTSSFFYPYILMQIPAGICVDLWGPRRVTIISFFLCSLAVIWFAYSHSFWEGQVSRMIMGLVTAPAIICTLCLGSRWFRSSFFPIIVSLTECVALLGGVIGEGGLAQVVTTFGWRPTMIGLAYCGFILIIFSLFFIYDFPHHSQSLHQRSYTEKPLSSIRKKIFYILSIKPLWINGLYAGFVFAIFPAFAALWAVPYFENRYGISVELSALLASTYFIGGCIGTLAIGLLSTYFAKKHLIMTWGTLIAFVLSLLIIYVPNISLSFMFFLMFLFGFFCTTYSLSFALADTYVSHKNKGVAMGFTNVLSIAFGAPLFQPLIGFFLKLSTQYEPIYRLKNYTKHDFTIALTILPISLLIAFIFKLFCKRKRLPDRGSNSSLKRKVLFTSS